MHCVHICMRHYICAKTKAGWTLKKTNLKLATAKVLEFTLPSNDSATFPRKVTHTKSNINNSSKATEASEVGEKHHWFSPQNRAPQREFRSHILYQLRNHTERVKPFSYIRNTSCVKIHIEAQLLFSLHLLKFIFIVLYNLQLVQDGLRSYTVSHF